MKNLSIVILNAVILILTSNTAFAGTDKKRPNIVFILVDDLGWSDLGCYGSEYYSTPRIDELAGEGMKFTSAYMMPTCSPSRASLMTGLYPQRTGIYTVDAYAKTPIEMEKLKVKPSEEYLKPENITIAEVLKKAGYVTGSFGKWHLGDNEATYPQGQGFDVNMGGCEAGAPTTYFSPFKGIKFIDVKEKGQYLTKVLTDGALKFIEDNKKKPFFLYFPFYQVHVPVNALKEWVNKYSNIKPSGEQDNPNYGAMVSYMDYSVGRVLDKLKELHLSKNTIVILTSDNGGQIMVTSNFPLKGQKGNLSEGGIRVPLIVRWPDKVKPNTTCKVPVTVVDYFPTIAEMANVKLPSEELVDGESFIPLLKGKSKLKRDAIFWYLPVYNGNGISNSNLWQPPGAAIRMGNWKLIENFEDHSTELYNLKKDIGETHNLSNKYVKKRQQLLAKLKKWQKETHARIPYEENPAFNKQLLNWIPKANTRIIGEVERRTVIK